MAVLFISHASRDDAAVGALETWLRANGFTDLFVDHHTIAGGDSWRRALQAAAGTCRVVLCLVTESWLASNQCLAEFDASFYMGKRVIPLLFLADRQGLDVESARRVAHVQEHYQGIDLLPCHAGDGTLDLGRDRALTERLGESLREAGALARVGLDPQAFAIDRVLRPMPFPGLASYGDEDADAALFYGRSREIAEALEELRKVRAEHDLRPLVVLGASGAGKSSLLKAGIIPRLRREGPAWLPLRAFRPGGDPLLNFSEAIARTLADFGTIEAHGLVRDRLFEAWSGAERADGGLTDAGRAALEAVIETEGRRLRAAAARPEATILVSVDQAEEIARTEGASGDALADYLRAALGSAASRWQLAFTIRTDSFPELQSHRRFQELKARGYDLRAIPVFRFDSVVEEPAKRYGVAVDDVLVDALMEDAPKDDALPLLAFALQRLWRQYAASGALTKANYDKVGGLTGLIEDAAERALRSMEPEQDAALPAGAASKRLVAVGAAAFVPALAQINEQGATIRRVAAWSSFDDEQQELLARFDRWRLVVRRADAAGGGNGGREGGTVEVAHEALFREWARLKGWLEPERARLDALRSLEVDAATWARNGRDAGFLNHRGRRLMEAEALAREEGYRRRLGDAEMGYLAACAAAERAARRRAGRVQAAVYALLVAIIAGLVGWIKQEPIKAQWRYWTNVRPFMMGEVEPYVLTAEKERVLQPGESFRECMAAMDCPAMVVVPAGRFMMGDEKAPDQQHEVTFVEPFAVSAYHVTFDDWDACIAHGDCDSRVSPGNWGRGRQPVINVAFEDAQRYVEWLSRMTGKRYRLLSEAEYEYVARGGTQTAYPWGNEIGKGNANCDGCGSRWDGKQAAPVGSFAANAFGLYDAVGNVYTWTADCVHENYDGAPRNGSAWNTTGDCTRRVVRGGSWYFAPGGLRAATRIAHSTVDRFNYLGFRVARTLTP